MLAVGVAACSALLDFGPVPKQHEEAGVGAGEGGVPLADAGPPVVGAEGGVMPSELTPACAPSSHTGCAANQLCCDHGDGLGPLCADTFGARECSACGLPCTSVAAPHCGSGRVCECQLGTGTGCAGDQRCLGSAGSARCVECEIDDDCRGASGGRQCVANKCVQCDRGASGSDASDDQGCNQAALPICSAANECVACSSNPDDCPGDQACNGALGCLGCNLSQPLDSKNCGGTRPICRRNSAGQPQCDGCRADAECGSGGYCDTRAGVGTGACTHVCSPTAAPGMNGCTAASAFCRPSTSGEFACQGCAPSDCGGATPLCASEGARRGTCVQCRTSADCAGSPSLPVCDAASGSCRARQASDCGAGSVFDPATLTCIDCTTSADCADTPATPACDLHTCVQCTADAHCSKAAAPLCLLTSHSCSACTRLGSDADAQCAAKTAGTVCVTQGTTSGQCGLCDPASNRGCSAPTPFCLARNNNRNVLACHECNPNDETVTCARSCKAVNGIYRCTTN